MYGWLCWLLMARMIGWIEHDERQWRSHVVCEL